MTQQQRIPISEPQREHIQALTALINKYTERRQGAVDMLLAQARATGNWQLSPDGTAMVCTDPPAEVDPATELPAAE